MWCTCCIIQCDVQSTLWRCTCIGQLWPFFYSPLWVHSALNILSNYAFDQQCRKKMLFFLNVLFLLSCSPVIPQIRFNTISVIQFVGRPAYLLKRYASYSFQCDQDQHDMQAAHRILNSFSLFHTQMFSSVSKYLFIRPNTKKKKKNLGKAKIKI